MNDEPFALADLGASSAVDIQSAAAELADLLTGADQAVFQAVETVISVEAGLPFAVYAQPDACG